MLIFVVKDLLGRSNQNSFRGIDDIPMTQSECAYKNRGYIILKPFQTYEDIEKEYEQKNVILVRKEIFA